MSQAPGKRGRAIWLGRAASALTRRCSIPTALVTVIALVGSTVAKSDQRPTRNPSTELRRVLNWFPEDSETLVAASSFSIPRRSDTSTPEKAASAFLPLLALGELHDDKHLEPLAGRKVLIAVNGMRLPQVTSKFGEFYAEGCSIVVFERELGQAAIAWTNALRKDAKETRKVAGREVFYFRSKKIKVWNGPGLYFAQLAPDTILCATHDDYLQQLLNRIDTQSRSNTPPRARAFPESLPQWTAIDRSAPAWMIRQIPAANRDRIIEGVTWVWSNNRARVVYLPLGTSAKNVFDEACNRWELRKENTNPSENPLPESLKRVVHTELGKDGRVAVSFKTDGLEQPVQFWLFLNLYVLQHDDGTVGPQ